MSNIQAHKGI